MADRAGPFDRHPTRHLLQPCREHGIEVSPVALVRLLAAQMQSPPLFQRDRTPLGPIEHIPATDARTVPDTPL